MKKLFYILYIGLFSLILNACDKELPKVYHYELTEYNVFEYIELTIHDIKVEFGHYISYELRLDINIDDGEGEPSNLVMIIFDIDIDLIFSYEIDGETYYIEDEYKFGAGVEYKDKTIIQERKIIKNNSDLSKVEILFDSKRINKVEGHIYLNTKLDGVEEI